ncbi:MAG: hypothetical protein C4530_13355 [Desulfobacteraceae bacterium]|nr:MAG: hypothetical protein C4530_13355 [Desulfobacteraceae bacterium]
MSRREIPNSKLQIPNNKTKKSNEEIFKRNQTEPEVVGQRRLGTDTIDRSTFFWILIIDY